MVSPGNLLLLLLLPVATAQMAEGSCFGCGSLPLWLLICLVAADAAVSLLIVVVVFAVFSCCRPRQQPPQDGKIYINLPGRG
ncbi:hematopoietic cell signal transducer [Suncus etruscus]|uniref:hematopoietic cell signal transducer n=1 Tax=Suncus etruscus TaxID=109475 RepID=UPI00210FB1F3|nr:hematopoietic cell signal transducer [Suncus etruscus]